MKALVAVHSDWGTGGIVTTAFEIADQLVNLLDGPGTGEGGSSLLAEFDDSAQGVADQVLGRGEVVLPVDLADVDKEFLG
jgi:hypothetical protein